MLHIMYAYTKNNYLQEMIEFIIFLNYLLLNTFLLCYICLMTISSISRKTTTRLFKKTTLQILYSKEEEVICFL